jgi:hypothetical protein
MEDSLSNSKVCPLYEQVETITWGCNFLRELPSGSALPAINMYLPEKRDMVRGWGKCYGLATRTGVKVVVWRKGEILEIIG